MYAHQNLRADFCFKNSVSCHTIGGGTVRCLRPDRKGLLHVVKRRYLTLSRCIRTALRIWLHALNNHRDVLVPRL